MSKLKSWADAKRGRIAALSKFLRVSYSFAYNMADGNKNVPVQHAVLIEQFTVGEVTRKDLRPNDWQQIWPELADQTTTNQGA